MIPTPDDLVLWALEALRAHQVIIIGTGVAFSLLQWIQYAQALKRVATGATARATQLTQRLLLPKAIARVLLSILMVLEAVLAGWIAPQPGTDARYLSFILPIVIGWLLAFWLSIILGRSEMRRALYVAGLIPFGLSILAALLLAFPLAMGALPALAGESLSDTYLPGLLMVVLPLGISLTGLALYGLESGS